MLIGGSFADLFGPLAFIGEVSRNHLNLCVTQKDRDSPAAWPVSLGHNRVFLTCIKGTHAQVLKPYFESDVVCRLSRGRPVRFMTALFFRH